jgi:hypothetical protein
LIALLSFPIEPPQGALDFVEAVMAKVNKPTSALKRGDFLSFQNQMKRETAIYAGNMCSAIERG